MRALDAIAGYGVQDFLDTFYKHMGRAYLEPHEEGVHSLFAKVRKVIGPAMREADTVRELIKKA